MTTQPSGLTPVSANTDAVRVERAADPVTAALLELAIALAKRYHKGQTDKLGEDYFDGHITAVMNAVDDPRDKVVAALHDLVEDTDVTFEDLAHMGFPDDIVADLDALTHRKGESNVDSVTRAASRPRSGRVKTADVGHNSNPRRLARLARVDPEAAARVTIKYEKSTAVLAAHGFVVVPVGD